jgi:hypothetical protein
MEDAPTPERPEGEPQESAADARRIDEASAGSFPASDPPSFWAGSDEPGATPGKPEPRR